MASIKVLDQHMVNMIAAGEVIERPASVVKELMENSIDAGAKNITVEISDGGKKLIRIIDDGFGMDTEDLEKAFLPHATSKIKGSDDLLKISTMGFRGEALASIGSVAKVSITSRQQDTISANTVEIDCGQNQTVKPASATYGTTVEVQNLFYKLPARRKFLKTTNTEFSHISEQFTRIALANLDITFTLIHNSRKIHFLPSSQRLNQRIENLFSNLSDDMLPVSSQEKNVQIKGFIGKPSSARASGSYQYVFLNQRYIKDKFISHAIKESYRGLIEPGKFPVIFLLINMPAEYFDVNVHPTKVEVRFENPNLLHSQIMAVIREKLMTSNIDATADFATIAPKKFEPNEMQNSPERQKARQAIEDFFKKHQPSSSQTKFNFEPSKTNSDYQQPPHQNFTRDNFYDSKFLQPKEKVLQIHDSYILVETSDGFEIIDQHALHERILYEKLLSAAAQGPLKSQKLLVPACINVTQQQQKLIENNKSIFDKLGMELQDFGPNTIAVNSFPVVLEKLDPILFTQDLLDLLSDPEQTPDLEGIIHDIFDMTACKAAIKAGKKLSNQEISNLLEQRKTAKRSSNCPHGRPTTITFSLKELEKQFRRT